MAFCHKTQRFHAKAASSGLPLLLSYNLLCKRNCLFSNGSAASCRHHYHLLPTKCYILICNMWLNARRKVAFRIVKDGLSPCERRSFARYLIFCQNTRKSKPVICIHQERGGFYEKLHPHGLCLHQNFVYLQPCYNR